jgi:plastocyanin
VNEGKEATMSDVRHAVTRALRTSARGAAAPLALVLLVTASEAAVAAVHTVTIDGFGFAPPSLTVRQGDTIEWRNTDPVPHTATGKEAGLESGEIAAHGSYRFTAKMKGRFAYLCTLHPIMKGEIVVE